LSSFGGFNTDNGDSAVTGVLWIDIFSGQSSHFSWTCIKRPQPGELRQDWSLLVTTTVSLMS